MFLHRTICIEHIHLFLQIPEEFLLALKWFSPISPENFTNNLLRRLIDVFSRAYMTLSKYDALCMSIYNIFLLGNFENSTNILVSILSPKKKNKRASMALYRSQEYKLKQQGQWRNQGKFTNIHIKSFWCLSMTKNWSISKFQCSLNWHNKNVHKTYFHPCIHYLESSSLNTL